MFLRFHLTPLNIIEKTDFCLFLWGMGNITVHNNKVIVRERELAL